MSLHKFKNRAHAGKLLAEELERYAKREDLVVLGLPRGGVPVAYQIACRLHAPLDVLVVRKLGVPGFEELAMGAIASGGVRVIDEMLVCRRRIPQEVIEQVAAREMKELRRREIAYRGHEGAPVIAGKAVLIVDDGIATGSTMHAALEAIRAQNPARIIVAVPTAPAETCAWMDGLADEVVCLMMPDDFHSVGQWYEDFSQTDDEQVTELLADAARRDLREVSPIKPTKRGMQSLAMG